jgi:hypothetical protein
MCSYQIFSVSSPESGHHLILYLHFWSEVVYWVYNLKFQNWKVIKLYIR